MTTPQGLAVSAAHDAAQARLLDRGLAELALAFTSTLDGRDLDASSRVYVPTAAEIVRRNRLASAQVATDFYAALRATETADLLDPEPYTPILPEQPSEAVLRTSLTVTGPVTAKSNVAKGLAIEAALEVALTRTLGAATRHIEGAARDVTRVNSARDPLSGGWVRRSGGVPCSFCAMLISRGPVYSEGTSGFKAHDHCHCKAVAFFGSDTGWTAQSREFREIYDLAKKHPDPNVTFESLYRARYPKTKKPADVRDEAYRSQSARKAAETRKAKKAAPATPEPIAPVVDLSTRRTVPSEVDVPRPTEIVEREAIFVEHLNSLRRQLAATSTRQPARRRTLERQIAAYEPYEVGLRRFAPSTAKVDALPRVPAAVVGDLSPDDHVQMTNPLFASDPRARINCVHVANTYELRRRGFEVSATPLPTALGDSGRDAQEALLRWRDPNGDPRLFEEAKSHALTRRVEAWPEGSRGWVTVQWKGGGGHIFNVERTPDGVRYYEAQSRQRIDFDNDYRVGAKTDVRFVRVDDLTPTDAVLEFVREGADEWRTLSTGRTHAIESAAL